MHAAEGVGQHVNSLDSQHAFDWNARTLNNVSGQLDAEKRLTTRALAQVEVLNQQIAALRRQLAALESALDASEKKDKESQGRIADLGQRLNVALAQRVQELSRYRSDFFGRLRTILGNRPDIRIVGDRFVFQSEVFFDSGQALLNKPISELSLSVRARKCMSKLNIQTVGDLAKRSGDELLECKNFGVTSLNEVREKLTARGLKLRGD